MHMDSCSLQIHDPTHFESVTSHRSWHLNTRYIKVKGDFDLGMLIQSGDLKICFSRLALYNVGALASSMHSL